MMPSIVFLAVLSLNSLTSALVLDVNNRQSILDAAATVAHGVQALYNGNQTGGVIGKWPYPPYYWWESGGAWGGMMHYWAFTGDTSYNSVMMDALVSQLGPHYSFNRPEEAFDTGNDDQAFWVFAAMSATEYNFPSPPSPAPPWLTIVENAWHEFASRWNNTNCNGGLKWQFHPENKGFYYKNSISNGAFFQLSARLARFTGNQTYADWADKIWNWVEGVGLISPTYDVFDGTDETINCSGIDHTQWSYNVGVFLYGAAMMSNYTKQTQIWVDRTTGLLAAANVFFSPFANATDVMFEAACEPYMTCNIDQRSQKAYMSRWLASTSMMAPYTAGRVGAYLRTSAIAAAGACTGGPYGNTCGSKWYVNGYDGITGLGQELSAMEVITALLVNDTMPPLQQFQITMTATISATASQPKTSVVLSLPSTTTASSPNTNTVSSPTTNAAFNSNTSTTINPTTSGGRSSSMVAAQTPAATSTSGGSRNAIPPARLMYALGRLLKSP